MSSEDCVGIKKYKEIDGDGNGVVVLAFEEGRTPGAEAQREQGLWYAQRTERKLGMLKMWREMQRLARDESGKVVSEHRIQGLLGFIEEP